MNLRQDVQQRSPIFKYTALGFVVLGLILLLVFSGRMIETVSADEIVVIQDPWDGDLHFYTKSGTVMQNFGKVTRYPKRDQLWFADPEGKNEDPGVGLPIRFNDGGGATLYGSVSWETPLVAEDIQDIHTLYGSWESLERDLITTVFAKSVYMTGPLMNSKESYAEKRNQLINYVIDQAQNGVYKTVTKEVRAIDPLSGTEKTTTQVEIVKDDAAPLGLARQETSPLERFNIKFSNFSLIKTDYDKQIYDQIETQRKAIMEVQTAIAEAKKAEQDAIKAEKEGQAAAARSKWGIQ